MADKPVFPLENQRLLEDGSLFKQHPGMTLREFAAISAMQGMLASQGNDGEYYKPNEIIRESVWYADSLLAELQKGRDA